MKAKWLLPLLLAGLSACGGSGGAPAASQPAAKLPFHLGLASKPAPALPNSVLWLAKDLGYYDKQGLDVTLDEMDGTPTVIAGLISGDIDVGNVGTDEALKLAAQKSLDIKAINSSDPRQYFMIASRDNIASVAGLAGKAFGVARTGSLDYTMSRLVLQQKGANLGAITFTGIGAPDVRAKALVGGQVAATTVSIGTWVTIQDQPGVKALVNVDDYYQAAPIVAKINVASAKEIQTKSDQLQRFTTAIIEVSRLFASNENAWVDAMLKRRPDLKKTDLEALWPQFKASWAVNGDLNLDEYQKTQDFLYGTADFKGVPKLALQDWTDTAFVDQAVKQLGKA